MKRNFIAIALAVGCASAAVLAQEVKTKTETKGDSGGVVSYTGCMRSGTQAQSYILGNVTPVSSTTSSTTSASSTTITTTTTYILDPVASIQFAPHVGHKVEVTGMMVGGDSKTETSTKIERENAPDTKIKEKTETEGGMPHFRVTSIKQLADAC